jgi:hypothetical protein
MPFTVGLLPIDYLELKFLEIFLYSNKMLFGGPSPVIA